MKKLFLLVIIGVSLIMLFSTCAAPPPSSPKPSPSVPRPTPTPAPPATGQVSRFLQGLSAASTSSFFPVYATYAEIANKFVPEMQVTLLNLGGSVAATGALMDKTVDICTTSSTVLYDAINGQGTWKDKAGYQKFRVLIIPLAFVDTYAVRKDSGISSIAELSGKKMSAGNPGGSTEVLAKQCLGAIGITPEFYVGNWSDAVSAIKDGRIQCVVKGTSGKSVDSSHIDIMTATSLRFIGFTPEQVNTIKSKYPQLTFHTIPAGFWKQTPDQGPLTMVSNWVVGPVVREDFPENLAYKWTKALVENWKEVVNAYPAALEGADVKTTPAVAADIGVYLHPGAARYFRESGVTIPEKALPPEAKK